MTAQCKVKIWDGREAVLPEEVNTEGLLFLPAVIDPHVHFRTPGPEHKENWISGAQAAVRSGVTTVFDMPNTDPPCITFEVFQSKLKRIEAQLQECGIPLHHHLYFGASRATLKEIPKVKDLAIGIKVFMGSSTGPLLIDDDATLEELFRIAHDLDMVLSVHAEDESTIRHNKNLYKMRHDPAVHSVIRSPRAAVIAVQKAIELAAKHQTRLCILHTSCQEELELIRQAKASRVQVFAEVAPHHLFLTIEEYEKQGTLVQVNPPLRTFEDREACWRAIQDGTIDFVGTDHAPHTLQEKALPYGQAPSGIPSIELLLPLLLNAVNEGKLTLQQVVKLTSQRVQELFRLKPNEDGVLVDMKKRRHVTHTSLKTKCKWSPYQGYILQGVPTHTLIKGKLLCLN